MIFVYIVIDQSPMKFYLLISIHPKLKVRPSVCPLFTQKPLDVFMKFTTQTPHSGTKLQIWGQMGGPGHAQISNFFTFHNFPNIPWAQNHLTCLKRICLLHGEKFTFLEPNIFFLKMVAIFKNYLKIF